MILPINNVLPDLLNHLKTNNTVLLAAAPGAGKTTQIPLALLNAPWLENARIIMLEPRRISARHAAHFMAKTLNESVGETIGYRIRLENRVGSNTRIEIVTESILTRMLQHDPELTNVGAVIFDEFHERHLASDLAFALTRQCQQLLRPDLRILLMSATLDESLQGQLDAPMIHSSGRSFPINIQYRPLPNTNYSLVDHCEKVIMEAIRDEGDLLVFLPGIREIQQLHERLNTLSNCLVLPLHGQLTDQEQKQALAPSSDALRKIILATNIAESSLTIDGVRIVIDSGLERRNIFHVSSGLHELKTRSISQASATQRAGRAGRQAPGICYRLWPESTHHRLDAHIRAEILDADLAPLAFELLQWGATSDDVFWQTPPPKAALHKASDLLHQLGICFDGKTLTTHGQLCARTGLEPRWAHALIQAHHAGIGQYACELVAVMQEFPATKRHSDDMTRLYQQARQHALWKQRVEPLALRLWNIIKDIPITSSDKIAFEDASALIIALAFPDRIAKRRDHAASFLLSNGRGVELLDQSDLLHSDWLACCDLSIGERSRIRLASSLSTTALAYLQTNASQLFSEKTQVGWLNNGQFSARKYTMLGNIIVDSTALPSLSDSQWQEAWRSYLQEHGLNALPWEHDAIQLRARMQLANDHLDNWPAVDDQALLNSLDTWFLPFISQARNLRDLNAFNTYEALLSLLSFEQRSLLNAYLPTHFSVPSGSSIALDYSNTPPVLAVKLQEMFGYEGQPSVLKGKLPLLIHLLSPAKRPLQVTADLPHFWRNTYAEVRKDMRGRYPKHPWPEDPLSAEATRLTKAAQARAHDK